MKIPKGSMGSILPMAYASTIGIVVVAAILGSLWVGSRLDGWLGTGSIFSVLFLLLGLVAGFRNMYMLIKRHFRDETEVIKSIKSETHKKRPAPSRN